MTTREPSPSLASAVDDLLACFDETGLPKAHGWMDMVKNLRAARSAPAPQDSTVVRRMAQEWIDWRGPESEPVCECLRDSLMSAAGKLASAILAGTEAPGKPDMRCSTCDGSGNLGEHDFVPCPECRPIDKMTMDAIAKMDKPAEPKATSATVNQELGDMPCRYDIKHADGTKETARGRHTPEFVPGATEGLANSPLEKALDRIGKVCSQQLFQLKTHIPVQPDDDDEVITDGLMWARQEIAHWRARAESVKDPQEPERRDALHDVVHTLALRVQDSYEDAWRRGWNLARKLSAKQSANQEAPAVGMHVVIENETFTVNTPGERMKARARMRTLGHRSAIVWCGEEDTGMEMGIEAKDPQEPERRDALLRLRKHCEERIRYWEGEEANPQSSAGDGAGAAEACHYRATWQCALAEVKSELAKQPAKAPAGEAWRDATHSGSEWCEAHAELTRAGIPEGALDRRCAQIAVEWKTAADDVEVLTKERNAARQEAQRLITHGLDFCRTKCKVNVELSKELDELKRRWNASAYKHDMDMMQEECAAAIARADKAEKSLNNAKEQLRKLRADTYRNGGWSTISAQDVVDRIDAILSLLQENYGQDPTSEQESGRSTIAQTTDATTGAVDSTVLEAQAALIRALDQVTAVINRSKGGPTNKVNDV